MFIEYQYPYKCVEYFDFDLILNITKVDYLHVITLAHKHATHCSKTRSRPPRVPTHYCIATY
jgi:hypothetical protein